MIRGAIDYIDRDVVSGWLHSGTIPLRGHTVMAFVDDRCVGAGTIEVFRKDLAEANVGDGHSGFHFGITLPQQCTLDRVVVKLENSDMVMLQRGTPASQRESVRRSAKTVEWMRARGWLDQVEVDFLRAIAGGNAYSRSLRRNQIELLDAREEANRLIDLYRQEHSAITVETMPLAHLTTRRGAMLEILPVPLVAIHAAEGTMSAAGAEHPFGADRLLFIDLRTALVSDSQAEARLFLPR